MWTNLYHNNPKGKYVRFLCDCTSSLENLRCGSYRSVPVYLRCRAHPTNNRGNPEIRQASMTVVIDENVELANGYQWGPKQP